MNVLLSLSAQLALSLFGAWIIGHLIDDDDSCDDVWDAWQDDGDPVG